MPPKYKQQRMCPGKDGRCGLFMAPLEDDPHPECARCRGIECSNSMRCAVCSDLDDAARKRWLKVLANRMKRRKQQKDAKVKEELHSSGA